MLVPSSHHTSKPLRPASRTGALLASILATVALIAAPHGAHASGGLVNGTFSTNGGTGQLTVNTTLTSWTGGGVEGRFGSQSTPPVFVFSLGTTTELSVTGATGDSFMGNVKFYGATAAPDAGPVVAASGDSAWNGSLSQTVSGLTIGQAYSLTFNWAGAQEQGFSGSTTEQWQVSFGSTTISTSLESTPSQTFAGWQAGSMTFTPTATSQVLKFLAVGSPSGENPWLLVDDVNLAVAVPEPNSSLMLGLAALIVITAGIWNRRRQTSP